MKFITIFTIIFALQISLAQQSETTKDVFKGIQVSAIPAVTSFNFNNINNILATKGLPQIKDGLQVMPAFSILSHSGSSDFFFEVTAGINRNSSSLNGSMLTYQGTFGELSYNKYLFRENRKYWTVGVAYGSVWHSANINNSSTITSFGGGLTSNFGSSNLTSNNNQYIGLKSGFDWAVDNAEDILIGVRLGYRFGIGEQAWQINGNSFSDSPTSSANGVFIGIALSMR